MLSPVPAHSESLVVSISVVTALTDIFTGRSWQAHLNAIYFTSLADEKAESSWQNL